MPDGRYFSDNRRNITICTFCSFLYISHVRKVQLDFHMYRPEAGNGCMGVRFTDAWLDVLRLIQCHLQYSLRPGIIFIVTVFKIVNFIFIISID